MKKLLIAFMCSVMLYGCGGSEAAEVKQTTISETEETLKIEEIPENLYTSENLVEKTVGSIKYQIPVSWDKSSKVEVVDDTTYFYDDDMMVMVRMNDWEYNSFDEAFEIVNEEVLRDSFLKGIIEGCKNYEIISSTSEKIQGITAFRFIGNATLSNDKDYLMDEFVFAYNKNTYVFGITTEKGSEYDYSKEFQSLIDSIKISDIDTVTVVFQEFKNKCLDSAKKYFSESDEALSFALDNFKDSYFAVRNFENFQQASDNDEFVKFILSISYLDLYMDEGSVGKAISDSGWEAIESLITNDGKFLQKMDNLKLVYELTGNELLESETDTDNIRME